MDVCVRVRCNNAFSIHQRWPIVPSPNTINLLVTRNDKHVGNMILLARTHLQDLARDRQLHIRPDVSAGAEKEFASQEMCRTNYIQHPEPRHLSFATQPDGAITMF